MKERRIIKLMAIAMVALSACYYDSEEDLYPASQCNTTNMSFNTHIAPIFQRNCYACHSAAANTGNITLEGHDKVMQHVTSGRLLGAIRHEAGFQPMPQGAAQLINCDISKIEQWIAQGAPDN